MNISKTKRIYKKEKVRSKSEITYPDIFRFGCEFEFYMNENQYDNIVDYLEYISGSDILINLEEIPQENDRNECLCLKYDSSLGSSGVEISTPICSYDTLNYYIGHISYIIDEYGTTNEDTGFHIHISVDDNIQMDFYAFILLCNDNGLLNNWGDRNKYSLNPMEILNSLKAKDAKEVKDRKGRVWSIERRGLAHIEVRTMGGTYYHKQVVKIIKELDIFIELFKVSISSVTENLEYIAIYKKHHKVLLETNVSKTKRFRDFISTIDPINTI